MEDSCSICNRGLGRVVVEDARAFDVRYDVYLCERCGVGTTIPVVPPDTLAGLYSPGNYRADGGRRFNAPVEYLVHLSRLLRRKRIERYVAHGRIVDIGCGRGLFLDVMRRRGWIVAGVEFNEETAANASEAYGITVIPETGMRERFPDAGFDVVTLYHVLEHTYRPAEILRECARLLRKGGLLVVAVPNLSGLQASFGKKHWFHLDPPYHLHHFSEEGLIGLLRKNSFAVSRIRRFDPEYNIFGWLQTLLNRTGIRKNLLYDRLKGGGGQAKRLPGDSKWGIFFTFALLPVYLPLSLILSFFESFVLKRGGTIEVYATKGEKGTS